MISTEYTPSFYVQCVLGHKMAIRMCDLVRGFICAKCNKINYEETYARGVFENMFGILFPVVRPSWLIWKTAPMELDGYNEDLKLAFEYQGLAHYEPLYGISKFVRTKQNDEQKRLICKKRGVYLLEVPYIIKRRKMEQYVLEHLPLCLHSRVIKTGEPISVSVRDNFEQKMRLDGYTYIATEISTCGNRIVLSCPKQHIFRRQYDKIRKGKFQCLKCHPPHHHLAITSYNNVLRIIKARGGIPLFSFSEYKNNSTPVLIKCSRGHEWSPCPETVISQGRWCPFCARKWIGQKASRAYDNMKFTPIVSELGITCSNENENGISVKRNFVCLMGHSWKMSLLAVFARLKSNKHPCPICNKKFRAPVVFKNQTKYHARIFKRKLDDIWRNQKYYWGDVNVNK